MSETPQAQRGVRMRWAVVLLLIAVIAVVGFYASGRTRSAAAVTVPTAAVVRGPLTISVTTSGTIKARQQETLKCEVEGQTTILYIIPEGTHVKQGDLLVELDSAKLQDQKVDKQILVQNAEAQYIRSKENLEVVKNQAASDIAKATLDAQFAQDDLRKYLEGDFPKEQKEAQLKIDVAREDLKRAADKLEWSKRLYNEKYLSQTELQADELSHSKTKLDVELAEGALKLLQNFTSKRKIAELQSNVEQTRMALERVRRKASADIVQAEADLRAKESEFQRQTGQLNKILRQIDKTKVIAPTAGMVVHGTSGQNSHRWGTEPLAEGVAVRERQDLIFLPTASSVMAEVKVNEGNLEKVRVDQTVSLTIDALPGQFYSGVIAKIAPMPDAQSFFANQDLKVYHTTIHVDGDGSQLRTGMSCRAEIIVEQHEDALSVPVQAVLRINGQPTVYVVNGDQITARPIQIGLDNNRFVHVLSGLKAGELVSLAPPLGESASTDITASTTRPTSRPAVKSGTGGMTAEQREAMRKRMESMSPEERQKAMEQMRGKRSESGGSSRGPGAGPGRPK